MSVVCENDNGWILDHQQFWNKCCCANRLSPPKENTKEAGQCTKHCEKYEKINFCRLTKEQDAMVLQKREKDSEKFNSHTAYLNRHTCSSLQRTSVSNAPKGDNYYVVSIKQELFSINHPFKMDSQFDKYASSVTNALERLNGFEKKVEKDSPYADESRLSNTERKRQRKRKKLCNELPKHIKELADHLEDACKSLLKLGLCLGHFKPKSCLPLNNNILARHTCKNDRDDMAQRVSAVQGLKLDPLRGCIEDGQNYSFPELCHRLYSHKGESPVVITSHQEQYLIPARSSFYMSHADQLNSFIAALEGQKFDVIVVDPPWENKSVKRKKMYYTLPDCDIKELPVISLANKGCLVVIWVTNNQKHQDYVKEVLFPHWSVQYLTQWHWLKVTIAGEPVTEILTDGKKPYESVILGRYRPSDSEDAWEEPTDVSKDTVSKWEEPTEDYEDTVNKLEESTEDSEDTVSKLEEPTEDSEDTVSKLEEPTEDSEDTVSKLEEPTEDSEDTVSKLEEPTEDSEDTVSKLEEPTEDSEDTVNKWEEPTDGRVIVSIPCILHSKKPPLQEILKPYCVSNAECIELFARNLMPGWTSWGNEVLRHQNLELYDSSYGMV